MKSTTLIMIVASVFAPMAVNAASCSCLGSFSGEPQAESTANCCSGSVSGSVCTINDNAAAQTAFRRCCDQIGFSVSC